MPLKIVRNDITRMNTDIIVNTANAKPTVGAGCDFAIYRAAGMTKLLKIRRQIGQVKEGDVFLTPGLKLPARYIIHAVSPHYYDGESGEEEKLRGCYRKSLELAADCSAGSIAFPLIGCGSFAWPKEEAFHIAVEEIQNYLKTAPVLQVYLVVFGESSLRLGKKLDPALRDYIDSHYVKQKMAEEYQNPLFYDGEMPLSDGECISRSPLPEFEIGKNDRPDFGRAGRSELRGSADRKRLLPDAGNGIRRSMGQSLPKKTINPETETLPRPSSALSFRAVKANCEDLEESVKEETASPDLADQEEELQKKIAGGLAERLKHRTDTFSEYLLYLIASKGMKNAQVYKDALVDKKTFSKIKNNPDAHPQKITCMCLCMGAKLNLDETVDLLARAGYALSPCDMTDIIFSFFIENKIYDMIELDLQLEEYGLPGLIPS